MNPDNAGDSQALVETFNKESPGSYDLFLDNLEIDTLMTPTEETGPALGTKVRFDVFEPYSVNGFIEALHVAGVAAGWGGYITATFLLKVDFSFLKKRTKAFLKNRPESRFEKIFSFFFALN
jgi:hypothetical protein